MDIKCARCGEKLVMKGPDLVKGFIFVTEKYGHPSFNSTLYNSQLYCLIDGGKLSQHIPDCIPFFDITILENGYPTTGSIEIGHMRLIKSGEPIDYVAAYDFCVKQYDKVYGCADGFQMYRTSLTLKEDQFAFYTKFAIGNEGIMIILQSRTPILEAFRNNVIKNPPTESEVLIKDLENIRDRFGKLAEEYLKLMRSYEETAKKMEDLPKG
jgi:hypothetical protein